MAPQPHFPHSVNPAKERVVFSHLAGQGLERCLAETGSFFFPLTFWGQMKEEWHMHPGRVMDFLLLLCYDLNGLVPQS